ncbi:hypothetical protein [Pararhizobium gei]|uniref:hypothetical protein n=1 Tax=Pararhizobium gei TaxID=1395951 RepID=UPI0023DB8789|nr:hypothetical protein [Rhizobium gei]
MAEPCLSDSVLHRSAAHACDGGYAIKGKVTYAMVFHLTSDDNERSPLPFRVMVADSVGHSAGAAQLTLTCD